MAPNLALLGLLLTGLTVCVGGGTDRLGGGGRRGGGGGGGGGGASWTVERELFDALTGTYDAGTRPVLSASTPVRVNFSISLHQIMDLAEKNQTLISHVWVHEEWVDEMLHWEPGDFGGIDEIIVPATYIWVPDLYVFNNADKGSEGFISVNESRAIVHHTGRVDWLIPLMIKSSCAVDVTYFPFDNQHCFIRVGSWIYDTKQLDLLQKNADVDMSHYVTNNEYELRNITLSRGLLRYEMFSGDYPQITMRLHIRRKPLYYSYTVVAPVIVLCFMTVFTFLLPCDNGAKVAIGLTVFLSLYVLQLAIAENIPEADSLPLISLFLTLVMTLNSISLLFATMVINIKGKGERRPCPEVPRALLALCRRVLGPLTCTTMLTYYDVYERCDDFPVPEPPAVAGTSRDEDDDYAPGRSGGDGSDGRSATRRGVVTFRLQRKQQRVPTIVPAGPGGRGAAAAAATPRYSRRTATQRVDEPRDLKLEWYFVASTLDKFFFIIFVSAMFLSVLFTLVVVPYWHRND